MKGFIAGVFVITIAAGGTSAPASAAGPYYVTVDTVGKRSVSDGKPSAGQNSLGEVDGYASQEDADKKLAEDP